MSAVRRRAVRRRWPQFYVEEHHGLVHSIQTRCSGMILEGVFEAFPNLKLVLIEGGFAWAPTLGWRLDAHWAKMRDEVPQVKRPPSFLHAPPISGGRPSRWRSRSTRRTCARCSNGSAGTAWCILSDYPHWDFDDPHQAFQFQMNETEKRKLFRENALDVYNFR